MKKSNLIIIGIILILVIIYIVLYFVNASCVEKKEEPIFYFSKKMANDGGSTIYNVLLYKIIKYKNIYNDDEIYEMGNSYLQFKNPFYSEDSEYFIEEH